MTDIDIRLQPNPPDQTWCAVFMRDGEPWILDGACVGISGAPHAAVDELLKIAEWLVIHGENFLTDGPIPLADREWLWCLLDQGSLATDDMYLAMQQARAATVACEMFTNAGCAVMVVGELKQDGDVVVHLPDGEPVVVTVLGRTPRGTWRCKLRDVGDGAIVRLFETAELARRFGGDARDATS
jgi:hypothetical protein